MKLPKSWKHWCKTNRFVTHSSNKSEKRQSAWFYLKGHGHVWRINDQGMFQRGDNYEEFDRWALCSDIHEEPVPQTAQQFKDFVVRALSAAKQQVTE